MSNAASPRFIVGPCGGGWWWVIDTELLTCSSPRPTRADAEQRRTEIAEQWQAAIRSQASLQQVPHVAREFVKKEHAL